MSHYKRYCDRRVHRRLVLTPAGRPITHAASTLEVVTCLLGLVIGKRSVYRSDIVWFLTNKQSTNRYGFLGSYIEISALTTP